MADDAVLRGDKWKALLGFERYPSFPKDCVDFNDKKYVSNVPSIVSLYTAATKPFEIIGLQPV